MRACYGAAALCLALGCQFDESGLSGSDDGALDPADGAVLDAPPPDAAAPDAPPPDAAPPPDTLPACTENDDYVERPGSTHAYRAVSDMVRWEQAAADCADDEAHLVVIDDADENDFVRALQGGNQWIGLNDVEEEGVFVWVTGALLLYENWAQSEPNNFFPGEDCVEMRGNGQWNDEGCEELFQYVCECDPALAPPPP